MNEIALPSITKNSNIGDSLKRINESFNIIKNKVDEQESFSGDIENFKKSMSLFADQLRFSHDFLKNKQKTYLDTFETINNSRNQYLKPLILFYPSKFRTDDSRITLSYIENVLYAWITKNYIITPNNLKKPNYIEGQRAFVYFLRSNETVKTCPNFIDADSIQCFTQLNNTLTITCTSRRQGRICINRCGCIDCGGTVSCQESRSFQCFFTDYGNTSKPSSVNRTLKGTSKYLYTEYPETSMQCVKFIVDECLWKVDGDDEIRI